MLFQVSPTWKRPVDFHGFTKNLTLLVAGGDCPPVDIKETICPRVDKLPGLLQSLHQIYGRDMGPGHQVTCTIPPHAAHKHWYIVIHSAR